MNTYKALLLEKKNHVGYIYFNNPANANRIGRAESVEMIQAFAEMDADKDVRAIILSGKGEYFCSGGKIDGFPDGLVIDQQDYAIAMVDAVKAVYTLKKPIIAAVNANALAGGVMFMDCCDIVVAGRDCTFGLPEIQRGYFPMIALAVLQKSMNKKRLLEMAFTGDLVDADTMLKWHLINYVTDNDKVMEKAEEIAVRIAGYNSMSTRFGRSAYYAMQNMDLNNALAYARTELLNMLWTNDARETAYAAEQNRAPQYKGC